MTKEEFITYVRAIIDMEIETAKRASPQYELIGALKLIEEALNKINEQENNTIVYPGTPPTPYTPINPMPPFYPGIGVPNTSPDWTYRPEHQPYYTINCTTSTANPTRK